MADQRLVKAIMSGKGYGMVLKGADLSGANLQGVNLERAILRNVDFTDTDLYGARLAEADFTGSDLRGADLSGADAFGAKFTGVKYDDSTKWPRGFTPPGGGGRMASRNRRASADPELVDMIKRGEGAGADLTDVDLEGADLRGANLKDAFMNDANLFDADLGGANLTGANLRSANFTGANLASAFLKGADLRNAKLMDADFTDAILGGANLTGANLRGANFQLAILQGAILQGLDLQGLDLRDAYLVRADLRDAYLRGADLRGANLRGAEIAGADLTGVKYDAKTVWPQGFTPPGGGGRMASRRLSRFEEGVPADPTKNMSPEDAAEWEEMNEKYGDKFKKASGGSRYAAGKIVAREPYMRALQRMQDAFDRSGGDPVKLYDAIDRRVRATRELGKLQGIYDAIVFDVMRGTFGPVPRFLDVRYKALLEQLQRTLYMSRSAQY